MTGTPPPRPPDTARLRMVAGLLQGIQAEVMRAGGQKPPHGKFGEFYSDANPHPNPAIQALHTAATKAHAAADAKGTPLPLEAKPGQKLEATTHDTSFHAIDPFAPIHVQASFEQQVYGNHQLGNALAQHSYVQLVELAKQNGITGVRSMTDEQLAQAIANHVIQHGA